jgi:hypothetical protein
MPYPHNPDLAQSQLIMSSYPLEKPMGELSFVSDKEPNMTLVWLARRGDDDACIWQDSLISSRGVMESPLVLFPPANS